jgi:hypothetical protein
MSWRRILILLAAVASVALIAVAATKLYFVRDLLAAFLMFIVLLNAFGIVVLLAYLVGEAVVRCMSLLVVCAALFRLHRPESSVAVGFALSSEGRFKSQTAVKAAAIRRLTTSPLIPVHRRGLGPTPD